MPFKSALTPGTRVGPYEILSTLGAGGMGEVYRARDAKLNRDVAIKVPLDEALPIARQIAEALDAAHDQGIIHRDLKPPNIKVRADGTVKVLDFGLAKAIDPAGASSANAMNSPTLSIHATEAGLILGTAAYMSPEQARGHAVDKRADLWSFGVGLHEMLTGTRLFEGTTISDTLAAVLTEAPDWSTLPATTPAPIRRLLRRCLEKDRRRRLSDAAAARLGIDLHKRQLCVARSEWKGTSRCRKAAG